MTWSRHLGHQQRTVRLGTLCASQIGRRRGNLIRERSVSTPASQPPASPQTDTGPVPAQFVRTLNRLAEHAPEIEGVRVDTVRPGDWVIVHTRNSVYSLAALGEGRFFVAGGWFKTAGRESDPVGVNGCTWGGPAIHTGLIAAPGMYLEFDNGVRTTCIKQVRLVRAEKLKGPARTH
jgi:hypothetical protein